MYAQHFDHHWHVRLRAPRIRHDYLLLLKPLISARTALERTGIKPSIVPNVEGLLFDGEFDEAVYRYRCFPAFTHQATHKPIELPTA